MKELGVLEARTDFSAVAAEVDRTGEEVIVTRHGRPWVKIVRADTPTRPDPAARRALIADIIRTRDEIAARHPNAQPFDIREALDRDRGEEW